MYPESQYMLLTKNGEPKGFQKVLSYSKWLHTMSYEMDSFIE